MASTPTYITIDDVKPWLYGKVRFGPDPDTEMTDEFLATLCAYGETEVLNDLNWFYVVPLVSIRTNDYVGLPEYTRTFLTQLFVFKSLQRVLAEEFAQKSAVIAKDYVERVKQDYSTILSRVTSKDPKTQQFRYAPLPDLKINLKNWTGRKVVPLPRRTGGACGPRNNMRYAIGQVTTPAVSWWNFNGFGEGDGCGNDEPCG